MLEDMDVDMEDYMRSGNVVDDRVILPEDVLNQIFVGALIPTALVDPDDFMAAGFNSGWFYNMKMKMSFVQVSRAWYIAGLKFLYEDLIITDARYTASLKLLLHENPSLAPLVKRIVLVCYVPECWGTLASKHLEELIAICPNARTFWDVTRCHPPPSFMGYLPRRAQNHITHLNRTGKFALIHAEDILRQSAPNLVSLVISTLPYLSSRDGQGDGTLAFPKLKTLRDPTFLKNQTFSQFPSLTSLTTELLFRFPRESFRPLRKQLEYLAIFGKSLRRTGDIVVELATLQRLITDCPNVKHLVLTAQEVASALESLVHPAAEWLDIWRPMFSEYDANPYKPLQLSAADLWKKTQTPLIAGGFPKLKNVRSLCSSLLERSPDLPIALPPDAISDPSQNYAVKWCDFDLRVGFEAVYCAEPPILPEAPQKEGFRFLWGTFESDDDGWTPTVAEENEDHTSDVSDSDSELEDELWESGLDDRDMGIDIPNPCDYTDFSCPWPEAGCI